MFSLVLSHCGISRTYKIVNRNTGSEVRLPVFVSSLTSWVTLGKLLNVSEPRFPGLQNENSNSSYLVKLFRGLSAITPVKRWRTARAQHAGGAVLNARVSICKVSLIHSVVWSLDTGCKTFFFSPKLDPYLFTSNVD